MVRLTRGWLYLVAIIDWYSRYVLSWELDQSLELPFVLEAVRRALGQARPAIINSDQGSQFTSPAYIELLRSTEVQISMDGKGRATDNIFTERLWRSLKYEEVYLKEYATPRQAREGITGYLNFYNNIRLHQSTTGLQQRSIMAAFHFLAELGYPPLPSYREKITQREARCSLSQVKIVS